MNFPANLKDFFAWFGGGTAVIGMLGYGIKLVLEKWLERRDEAQKAERQTELEAQKAELVRLTEQLKHGLEKEMLKAQLSTSKAHKVEQAQPQPFVRKPFTKAEELFHSLLPTSELFSGSTAREWVFRGQRLEMEPRPNRETQEDRGPGVGRGGPYEPEADPKGD